LKKLEKVHYNATLCTTNHSRSHPGLSLPVCSNKPVLKHCLLAGTVKKCSTQHFIPQELIKPVPLAWVCGHLLAGIVGSNPTEGTDVCLLGAAIILYTYNE